MAILEGMIKFIKRIGKESGIILLSIMIVLLILILIYVIDYNFGFNEIKTKKRSSNEILLDVTEVFHNNQEKLKKRREVAVRKQVKNEHRYTGTIEPYTYIATIISIDNENRSIQGITSNIETYSGLMEFRFDFVEDIDLTEIKLYETYNIECEPLIFTADVPYIKVIKIRKSTERDIQKFNATKKEVSQYIKFKLACYRDTLESIITEANKLYFTWTDSDIDDFQQWIIELGYTEDFKVKSKVETVEQLKNRQIYK